MIGKKDKSARAKYRRGLCITATGQDE